MSRRGLSEKVVYAFNPMPDIDDAEIVKRTGLEMLTPRARGPFYLDWTYSTGNEKEVVTLAPGSFTPFRESEIRGVLLDTRDQGIVRVNDPSDEAEVKRAREEGVRRAFEFWNDRGGKAISRWQKTHGASAEDLSAHAYELEERFRNKAKAEVLQDFLTGKAKPAAPTVAPAPAPAATKPAGKPAKAAETRRTAAAG